MVMVVAHAVVAVSIITSSVSATRVIRFEFFIIVFINIYDSFHLQKWR